MAYSLSSQEFLELNVINILHKSEYRYCAIGIMVKDENSKRKAEEKNCSVHNTSILHHIVDLASRSTNLLWVWHYPVAQTEVGDRLWESYLKPLTK